MPISQYHGYLYLHSERGRLASTGLVKILLRVQDPGALAKNTGKTHNCQH